jgi:hypothetical protein
MEGSVQTGRHSDALATKPADWTSMIWGGGEFLTDPPHMGIVACGTESEVQSSGKHRLSITFRAAGSD